MDLYRDKPGALERSRLADALVLADTACALLLDGRSDMPSGRFVPVRAHATPSAGPSGDRYDQRWLGVTITVALTRLRAYAYAHERRLGDVAADMVARRLRVQVLQRCGRQIMMHGPGDTVATFGPAQVSEQIAPTKVNEIAEKFQLADVFVGMADTLVDDFDLIDFLHVLTERCVQLLPMCPPPGCCSPTGTTHFRWWLPRRSARGSSSLFQLQTDEGPCLDCFRTGQQVSVVDLALTDGWPRFAAAAADVGYRAVHALPMRLRTEVIGALNLFDVQARALDPQTLSVGQALADVATIGLLQQRTIRRSDVLVEQLQTALNTRVLIEQAKGVVAERLHVDVAEAFRLLRSEAPRW